MNRERDSSYRSSMGPRTTTKHAWTALGLAALVSCGSAHLRTRAAVAPAVAASSQAPTFGAADVDRALEAEWAKRGIVASARVDDERFLRRVTLDIIGRIPTIEEIERFHSDRSEDRRAAVVRSLLASPAYADHWTNYWEDVLLLDKTKAKFVDRDEFRRFLHGAFEKNLAWSDVVHELVNARGVNRAAGDAGTAAQVNGAVNWLLQYRDNPQDLAGKVASTFLGVKIQCAQCHDHKTEKWKQKDFVSFAACFAHMKATPLEPDAKTGPVALFEANRVGLRRAKKPENAPIAQAAPVALDGTDFSNEDDRRAALAAWTTSPQNPWFARAFVNRVWGYFLGRGFVEPVDDFRASNPGEMPDLLDALAKDFAAHGYDAKRLIALIASTEAYQLSSAAPSSAAPAEPALWSRYPLKPLAPDELLDSIAVATDLDDVLAGRGGDDLEKAKAQLRKQFDFLFDVDEESHAATFEGTIPQALMLMNGRQVNRTMRIGRQGALLKVLAMPAGDERRVEALFLRTVSRKPTPDEAKIAIAAIPERGAGRQAAFEDLFWALLNSSEFVFNH